MIVRFSVSARYIISVNCDNIIGFISVYLFYNILEYFLLVVIRKDY